MKENFSQYFYKFRNKKSFDIFYFNLKKSTTRL